MLNHWGFFFFFFAFFLLFFFLRLGLGQRRAVVIIGRWLLPSLVDTGDICCHYWQHILVIFVLISMLCLAKYFLEESVNFNHALLKPLPHQGGVLMATARRARKTQNAKVRAVRSPRAPRDRRCIAVASPLDAVGSPRTPCHGAHFVHAQSARRGSAFPRRSEWAPCERSGFAAARQ